MKKSILIRDRTVFNRYKIVVFINGGVSWPTTFSVVAIYRVNNVRLYNMRNNFKYIFYRFIYCIQGGP